MTDINALIERLEQLRADLKGNVPGEPCVDLPTARVAVLDGGARLIISLRDLTDALRARAEQG